MDETVPEAAQHLREYLFVLRRRGGEGKKACAQRISIVAEKLGQSSNRVEGKRATSAIKLEKKARPGEKSQAVQKDSREGNAPRTKRLAAGTTPVAIAGKAAGGTDAGGAARHADHSRTSLAGSRHR